MTDWVLSFAGGMLIGLAAVILFLVNGRIMGVSGIVSRLLAKPSPDTFWRIAFIVGLVVGGWAYSAIRPVPIVIGASWPTIVAAGFLVGFGTVMANGCTSGHGVCGIARLSKRSIIATITFMGAGIVTVWLKHLMGG